MVLLRGRLAFWYVFTELLPGFIIGVLVFVFILLMFQVLRLTETMLVHGVDIKTTLNIMLYLTISFLPAVLPMSLLFSVLLTFSRLSSDSEIVAFKAMGLNLGYLLFPTVVLGALIAAFSAHTAFFSAPWGNRQFELLVTKIGNSKAAATIREGTFSEGFFDFVVYAKKVDSKNGKLEKVFIYDEGEGQPMTIIARNGAILPNNENANQGALLRLMDGDIHRTAKDSYTKIHFESYDISLAAPIADGFREKSPLSLTYAELKKSLASEKPVDEPRRVLEVEYHKRWAIAAACLLFSFLGVGMGTNTNRRSVRSGSLVMSIGVIVSYWALYVAGESMAKSGSIAVWPAIWFANFVFFALGTWFLRKNWS
jgi:lipopolysaccharide export system permease protein